MWQKTTIEEWINYLKTGEIKKDTTVPRLSEARQKLIYYNMSESERHDYDEHVNALMVQNDVLCTARLEGLMESRLEERRELARKFKNSVDIVTMNTGFSEEEIFAL